MKKVQNFFFNLFWFSMLSSSHKHHFKTKFLKIGSVFPEILIILWNFAFSGNFFSELLQSWEGDSVNVWGIKWHPRYPSYMPGSKKPRIFISVPRKIGGAICPPPCRNRLAPTPCRNRVNLGQCTVLVSIYYIHVFHYKRVEKSEDQNV